MSRTENHMGTSPPSVFPTVRREHYPTLRRESADSREMIAHMPRISAATVAENRDLRRGALLDAARAILTEEGSAGLTMSAVAAAAGLSRPAAYEYFGSVDELVAHLVVGEMVAWRESIDRELAAAADLETCVAVYVDRSLDYSAQAGALAQCVGHQPVDQRRVVHAGGRPHAREHRDRREARHRVDLVQEQPPVAATEEVDARQALAPERLERRAPPPAAPAATSSGVQLGRHHERGGVVEVLGLEVVELVRPLTTISAHTLADGPDIVRRAPRIRSRGRDGGLDDQSRVVLAGSRDRRPPASSEDTLLMPSDDPARAGLTNTGRPRAATAASTTRGRSSTRGR
jgi:AcrR family transcriptional regulator